MLHGLPSHIWIALVGDDVIVLDLRADRYSQLGSVASAAMTALAVDQPLSTKQALAARQLAAAGILTADGSGRRVSGSSPTIPTVSALEQSRVHIDRDIGLVRCGLSVFSAKARLRTLGLERTLAAARKCKDEGELDAFEGCAVPLAQSFARRRAAIPITRSCLPDSLALFGLLMGSAIDATLVIGVRIRPFAAHCWVQAEQTLLNDAVAPIQELTPIMSI